jgi:hypothetical protein
MSSVRELNITVYLSTNKFGPYKVNKSDTMLSLKKKVAADTGFDTQQITFNGSFADNDKTFDDLGLYADTKIYGKVKIGEGGRRRTRKSRRKTRKSRRRKY